MKLNYKITMLIGLAFMSICSFWQVYDSIIPLILKNSFGIGETLTGAIMAADNVLALFLLPLFGSLSDKIDTPLGKRMPFILIGTTLACILLFLLPVADNSRNLTLFVVALFFILISMGLYRSPAVALMPDLTPKSLRSRGNAIINLMGTLGGIYGLLMIKFLVGSGNTPNYLPLFMSIAVFMIICVAILFFTIKENQLRKNMDFEEETTEKETASDNNAKVKLPKEVQRSLMFMLASIALWFIGYNAVTTAFSRYATEVWGLQNGAYADCLMVATVTAVIGYVPIAKISATLGRKKTILIGIILLMICYGSASFYSSYHGSMVFFFGLIGFAWASITVNSLPMVVEMCSASDVGKYTGYYYTFSMSAQVITPILSGFLMEKISYRVLFPYAVIFTAFAFVTMLQVKHGDARPVEKKSVLENFDIED
ncbi:MAG: MFS transporter [Lachnospiraceae bacterium]|nr:MFS transporter [Lachnospiraceae bacterium]